MTAESIAATVPSFRYLSLPFLSPRLADLAPALKNHLWQSTLFAIVAALLAQALRRNRARTRFWLWLAASIKFLIPFSLLIALGGHLARPRVVAPAPPAIYFAMEQVSQPFTPALAPAMPPVAASSEPRRLMPLVLGGVWFAGSAAVLGVWFIFWRRIAAVVRAASPVSEGRELRMLRRMEAAAGLRRPIRLLASNSSLGPGIYGIAQPMLIWPSAISERLDDAHLQSVLAHEICHVRRRDNLTAALHMVVEAVFWFHPFVWWLGARLEAERERACDEAVLEASPTLAHAPRIYAESILKVCEFYVESPLPCVSGVTSADLKKRLADILNRHAILKLSFAKIALLTAAGLATLAVPILLGQARAVQTLSHLSSELTSTAPIRSLTSSVGELSAQAVPPEATKPPEPPTTAHILFEVASIRPPKPGSPNGTGMQFAPDGLHVWGMSLSSLLMVAYQFQFLGSRIAAGPDWVRTDAFNIEAKVSESDAAAWSKISQDNSTSANNQRLEALQVLLVERFKLKTHRETRQSIVYALVVAKGGPKLKPSTPDQTIPNLQMKHRGHIEVKYASIAAMAPFFAQELDHPVVDKTGLDGKYDFTLDWTPDTGSSATQDNPAPSLFTAVQEQLGLKLEQQKAPVEYLVIDHAERPSQDGAELLAPMPGLLSVALPQQKSAQALTGSSEQSPDANAAYVPAIVFDVASVRESKVDFDAGFTVGGWFTPHTSTLRLTNMSVENLLAVAYGVQLHQISGVPRDFDQAYFNIEAKGDEAANQKLAKLTTKQEHLEDMHMLQALLADRFKLKAHFETREGPVYNLVIVKSGPKLHSTGEPPSAEELKNWGDRPVPTLYQRGSSMKEFDYIAHACPMSDLVHLLSGQFGRPVVDTTSLTGKYDFVLKTHDTRDRDRRDDDTNPLPTLETAIQQELGLKLESGKGQEQVLVIDHIERPTEN